MVVGADARAVRPYMLRNNQLVHPFTRQLSTETRADVRPLCLYMHSNGMECWQH